MDTSGEKGFYIEDGEIVMKKQDVSKVEKDFQEISKYQEEEKKNASENLFE